MKPDLLWDRFERALERHAPRDYAALQPPATEEQIKAAEKAMRVRFPKALKAAYRRHNGVVAHPPGTAGFFLSFAAGLFPQLCDWCSLDRMVDNWQMMVRVAEGLEAHDNQFLSFPLWGPWWEELPIRPGWYHKKWIPIGLSYTASSYYIDLIPGTKGQLIYDSGMGEPFLVAPGLDEWIGFLCEAFETGRFYTHPETGEWFDAKRGGKSGMGLSVYWDWVRDSNPPAPP
jgi:cell wall assembly regulator SMI1